MRQGGYAQWYQPIRTAAEARVAAKLPNTLPGVAFLQSPILVLMHVDKLKRLVAEQREEVTQFKASLLEQ